MYKKIFTTLLTTIITALFLVPAAYAEGVIEEETEEPIIKAVIQADTSVETGRNIIFDASNSYLKDVDKETVRYEWSFGDGNADEGIEVVHTYRDPQLYNVALSIRQNGELIAEAAHRVHVYRKLTILLTDKTEEQNRIQGIKNYASDEQVFIEEIESFGSASEFISEEILAKRLKENTKIVDKAKQIIVWTNGNAGLNALSRFLKESNQKLTEKVVIVIASDIGITSSRIERQFPLLQPKKILIITESAIYPLIESTSEEKFMEKLEKEGYPHKVIDSKSGRLNPWNFMSYFVNFLIESGIPDNTVILILLLPIIATVVAFMRQLVGITTFGIYSPSIITLALLILGLKFGLITFMIVLAMGGAARHALRKTRLLFIPKMAIVLTFVSLTIFALLIITIYFNWFDAEFIALAIFPILIMSTLSEKFINAQSERGFLSAMVLMGETILVSIIAYFVVGGAIDLGLFTLQWEFVKNLMLAYPELIFLILIINILLGRWTGLRILEYVRFREILRHIEE
ncbi:MAG: 7TM domain-containing protein [Patescibacteria group bacterium]|nr:PKD domain-containing protein [Patescibacteria group bacterium]